MIARSWYLGAIVGFVAGLLVSVPVTISDWRRNPSGLFHDDQGTNWAIVTETAFSWFWPVALFAFVATALCHSWLLRTRQG